MNEERVIKVTRCGDHAGCAFDDRISIEFSPNELTLMETHFHDEALKADKYDTQTEMREMRETFKLADGMWKECRRNHK